MPDPLEYDPADALVSDEAIALFLADAQATGDLVYLAKAQAVVERALQRRKRSSDEASETRTLSP